MKIEKNKKLQILEQERRRYQRARHEEYMNELRESESRMTTPRSLARREIIRFIHSSMKRQVDDDFSLISRVMCLVGRQVHRLRMGLWRVGPNGL